MRRLCVVVGMFVLASLLPEAASAGPITINDPIIGVRGGMFRVRTRRLGPVHFVRGTPSGRWTTSSSARSSRIAGTAFSAGIDQHYVCTSPRARTPTRWSSSTQGAPSPVSVRPRWKNGDLKILWRRDSMATGVAVLVTSGGRSRRRYRVRHSNRLTTCGHLRSLGLTAQVTAVNDTPLHPVPGARQPAPRWAPASPRSAGRRLRRKSG